MEENVLEQQNSMKSFKAVPRPPALFFVMRICAEVGAPLELGEIGGVKKRVIPITGGSFEGVDLQGEVLAGGADWQYTRPDHVAVLEARYTLRSSDGALITVVNRGFRHGIPGLAEIIASGREVSRSDYYFMSAPLFETSDPKLAWLTRAIFIGEAEREVNRVLIDVWQVGEDWARPAAESR